MSRNLGHGWRNGGIGRQNFLVYYSQVPNGERCHETTFMNIVIVRMCIIQRIEGRLSS
jgi:hypothetical protein